MVNTRQSTSMSTAESYANRAEASAAAAVDKAMSEGGSTEEATVAAHNTCTAFVSPIAAHPAITQTTVALEYPRSSNEDGPPPLEPGSTPNEYCDIENEEEPDANEKAEDSNEADGDDYPLLTSSKQEASDFVDFSGDASPY